ncbi:histidine phosphatase family protein [Mobilibacterium timonense]|uniref:histidine phosphatase family protein n=1 Tax=Mobilibacterium timonense TaxID=1871012 RepID=UPI0009841B9F|nr:histidine phosphatase family protein [Mobilibacterium timonense]
MMNQILLIRHGKTAGNIRRAYIGSTDEPLCPEGLKQMRLLSKEGLSAQRIITSPMKRTIESAAVLFPGMKSVPDPGLRETDFGVFEGKTADEISSDPELGPLYSAWLDTGCQGPVPGGEDIKSFKERVCSAFECQMAKIPECATAAFVIHGGCIMAIMEKFAIPHHDFYHYHIANGAAIRCTWDGSHLEMTGGALC